MAQLKDPLAVAHLLRRAGFGHDPTSWETLGERPYEEVVEALLADLDGAAPEDPAGFDPYEPGAIQQLWLERMVSGRSPLAEKLALFWHGHFATSNTKVQDPQLMWTQYRLLRAHGGGRFGDLVLRVSRDVAMVRWLDGNSNRKGNPNENYGRELQELFTLGIGNYTEQDVREVARAFTGWGSRHHTFLYDDTQHDHGDKTIHGRTGDLGGEQVVALLTGLPACHRFVAGKLLRFFSHPDPTPEEVARLAAAFAGSGGDVKSTLRALFTDPAFRAPARYRALVKSPVELAVGALRAAGFRSVPPWIHGAVDRMGQILFRPPSVKGWTRGPGWLSSAGLVERLRVAERLSRLAPFSAADSIEGLALDVGLGDVPLPPALTEALARAEGREKVATALGCPEFQLA